MSKYLFIVEGTNDEEKFINRLFEKMNLSQKYEIVTYNTNIHNLANILINNNHIDDSLDIKLLLREFEKDKEKKKLLSQDFSDIILVFDFEPQQDHPRFEQIRLMLEFFNDSTNNGKLYINYPMMQSYRHFGHLPDDRFKELKVLNADAKNYKQLVNEISKYKDAKHHSYALFVSLAYHHLLKFHYIINNQYILPTANYVTHDKYLELFDIQYKHFIDDKYVYVINTLILFMIEYNTKTFYNQVTRHKSKYSI